jgi:hypothetical protein
LKSRRALVLLLAVQFLVVSAAWCQGDYKAATAGAAPGDVPAALSGALDSQGVTVTNGQGATLCEVWLQKTIPGSANSGGSSDVLYGGLSQGTLLGVIHFPAAASDFRGQAIKPGFYTMRYALIPQDGNHMGVNPTRDAIVLVPVAADPGPAKTLDFDSLVKLGRQASGTAHPALLVAAQPNGNSFPSVFKDDQGHWDIQMKGHTAGGDLSLAVTVVGKFEG